jgi:hypothetical protein
MAVAPSEDDLAGWLSLMQHYRLPTRLLDWSFSPLIAAYFSVNDRFVEPVDACIWALAPSMGGTTGEVCMGRLYTDLPNLVREFVIRLLTNLSLGLYFHLSFNRLCFPLLTSRRQLPWIRQMAYWLHSLERRPVSHFCPSLSRWCRRNIFG